MNAQVYVRPGLEWLLEAVGDGDVRLSVQRLQEEYASGLLQAIRMAGHRGQLPVVLRPIGNRLPNRPGWFEIVSEQLPNCVLLTYPMGNARSCHNDYMVPEMPHRVRELHFAVKSNDRDTVRSLVAQGVNINFPFLNSSSSNSATRDGNTPLIIAVSLNYTEIVEVLLHAGAYINKCDRNGCTPVYKAAFHGRPSLIERLTKAGADVNLADFQGKTPLYICVNNAIVHSSRSAIVKLLAAGAIVDKCDRLGQAPLHVAAHWKLVDILAMLIAARSNVNISDRWGQTPLYVCVSALSTKFYAEDVCHQLPCIITLFRAGADMLNLVEWLLVKGPGIGDELLPSGSEDFRAWYLMQLHRPMSLTSLCRKVIQLRINARISDSSQLAHAARSLPLPSALRDFVSRKMFYRVVEMLQHGRNLY